MFGKKKKKIPKTTLLKGDSISQNLICLFFVFSSLMAVKRTKDWTFYHCEALTIDCFLSFGLQKS